WRTHPSARASADVKPTVHDVFGHNPSWDALEARGEQSLHPRSPDTLLDVTKELGIGAGDLILDVGCWDARYAVALVQRYGCRAAAIELTDAGMAKARERVEQAGLSDRVRVEQASIEAIPLPDGSCRLVWCRDMLNLVPHLRQGLRECARVLQPAGTMLVYVTLATNLLEPREARRLYKAFAIVSQNMSRAYLEEAIQHAGLRIRGRDMVDSEWREYWEEHDNPTTTRALLRLARLRRREEQLVAEFGRMVYEMAVADCHWGVYQMLGKLCPTVYLLDKA